MKTLMIAFFLLVSISSFAQGPDYKSAEYFYMIPVKNQKGKTLVSIDYGQKVNNDKEFGLTDESGKLMEFNSIAGAHNYFATQGYEFIAQHTLTYGTQSASGYLFRKRH